MNYKVKETDLKGKLDGFPLELAQLAFDNAKNLYRDFEEEAPTDQELIKLIQDIGFTGLFVFAYTEEGHEFWEEISNGNLNAFQELKEGKSFKSLDASKQSDCEFSIKAESGMVKSTINGSGAHIAALIASAMKADPRIESVMRSAITLIHKN